MYNPLHDPFYPCKDKDGRLRQVPLRSILLGEIVADPVHPDPALEAFLRYIPSLFLQVLQVELSKEEWNSLTKRGVASKYYPDFKERLSQRLEEKKDFFNLYPDKNGFYQHYDVKTVALQGETGSGCKVVSGQEEGLDGLLLHSVSGNNTCHHKRPATLRKICVGCALTGLLHHNNFCTAGLAGHANFRGPQAWLCMIHAPDSFQRMILNTYLSGCLNPDLTENQGWLKPSAIDQPSWLRPGQPKDKGFQDLAQDVGLLRAMLYTPRHVFFEIQPQKGICDLCGMTTEKLVERYYWRGFGNRLDKVKDGFVGHPTLATYVDEKAQRLPQNYKPDIWRNLACLSLKDLERDKNHFQMAPLVQQFEELRADSPNFFYQLELQAYEADQAKLLGFHHQVIQLPFFTQDQKEDQQSFYQALEDLTSAMTEMTGVFRKMGSADKKRSQEQLPHLQDTQDELVQHWGEEILNRVSLFRQAQQQGHLFTLLRDYLKTCQTRLVQAFHELCESFGWEDVSAQRKLHLQKQGLEKMLNKIYRNFLDNHPSEGETP
ncbi:type I-E CRISPR-associated protein Cse1/CasA [Deltaproteobacteria bacterium TL4]